jgi:beta-glucuronidase
MFRIPLLAAAAVSLLAQAAPRRSMDLSGEWKFFPDYLRSGETTGWWTEKLDDSAWDTVDVPHIWNLDPRYEHTGLAWYRRKFAAPAAGQASHARLRFEAVFYKCKVWLNGTLLGEHEGGYTAFDLDAGHALRPGAENVLAILVDNSWSTETVPGARGGERLSDQTYPWWNYGGLKKPVYLEFLPVSHITGLKIHAVPDLAAGTAEVNVRVSLRNTGTAPLNAPVRLQVRRPGEWSTASASASVRVPAGGRVQAELRLTLPAPVALWDVDRPRLYEAHVELAGGAAPDALTSRFGVRKLEVRDSRLMLNGEPVSLGGANRVADHPRYGSMENHAVIEQDMPLMKSANLGLSRILHYPPSQALLDWCDEHGFLLIAEPGGWGLKNGNMESEKLRATWKTQAKEMLEQSWNHPSVIGWSVGNEYESDTPSGVRWTRDMAAFVRALDDTRFITFASLGGKISSPVKPEENSFHYVDLLSVNIYGSGGLARAMETLAKNWPGKPVIVTEFGWREDSSASEESRGREFRNAISILRRYPFVTGASVWTFNDYRSRHPGTNSDGLRRWGMVTYAREPRPVYHVIREEFSPATLSGLRVEHKPQGFAATYTLHLTLEGRAVFPSRVLRDHSLVVTLRERGKAAPRRIERPVPELKPGDRLTLAIPLPAFDAAASETVQVEFLQPGGFVSLERILPVRADQKQP